MMATLMVSYHVTLIPQYVLFLNIGWVDTILPLVVPKFLAVDAFFIFLMVQFFRSLPRELDEAAMIDGCGPWRIFFKDYNSFVKTCFSNFCHLLFSLDLERFLWSAYLPQ